MRLNGKLGVWNGELIWSPSKCLLAHFFEGFSSYSSKIPRQSFSKNKYMRRGVNCRATELVRRRLLNEILKRIRSDVSILWGHLYNHDTFTHGCLVLCSLVCSGSRSSKTFKPKKNIPEGSHQYELLKHAEATLGSGNLRQAVMLPEGEDLNEWIAVNSEWTNTMNQHTYCTGNYLNFYYGPMLGWIFDDHRFKIVVCVKLWMYTNTQLRNLILMLQPIIYKSRKYYFM